MSYLDWWQDRYDNLLPEDFEDEPRETEDDEYTEECEDEQDY
jgi:hypothetical protein